MQPCGPDPKPCSDARHGDTPLVWQQPPFRPILKTFPVRLRLKTSRSSWRRRKAGMRRVGGQSLYNKGWRLTDLANTYSVCVSVCACVCVCVWVEGEAPCVGRRRESSRLEIVIQYVKGANRKDKNADTELVRSSCGSIGGSHSHRADWVLAVNPNLRSVAVGIFEGEACPLPSCH